MYVDASLLIAWASMEKTTPVDIREGMTEVLRRVDKGELHLVLSTIHKPECLTVGPFIDRLFEKKRHVTVVDVTVRIANRAREYMRTYSLKPPDAIHLATASLYQCESLFTRDAKLLKARVVDTTRVCLPPPPRQRELDLHE